MCVQWGASGPLRRAEARVGLGAACTDLGVLAGGHGAGHRVAGAGAALEGLLGDHLLQRVLLLYLEDVWLLPLVLADAERQEGRGVSVRLQLSSVHQDRPRPKRNKKKVQN